MDSLWPLLTILVCPLVMGAMMILMMRGSHAAQTKKTQADPPGLGAPGRGTRTIRYVRNLRTEAIRVWIGGTPFRLAERGSPGDMLALPSAALNDPDLAGYLDLHWVEEIDESTYAASGTSQRNGTRATTTPQPGRGGRRRRTAEQ